VKKVFRIFMIFAAVIALVISTGCSNLSGSSDDSSSAASSTVAGVTVSSVSFSPTAGEVSEGDIVTLSTATKDAAIIYSTDSTLSESTYRTLLDAGSAKLYTTGVAIDYEMTIYALALKSDMSVSDLTNAAYTISKYKVKAPAISAGDTTVTTNTLITLTSATPGAVIYYTLDGTNPTTASTVYTLPFTLEKGDVTVKTFAVKTDLKDSSINVAAFTVVQGLTYKNKTTGNYTIIGNISSAVSEIVKSPKGVTFKSPITITGYVIGIPNSTSIIIQDETSAIMLFGSSLIPADVAIGDKVSCTATKGKKYNDVPEITAGTSSIIGSTTELFCTNITNESDWAPYICKLCAIKPGASFNPPAKSSIKGDGLPATFDGGTTYYGYINTYYVKADQKAYPNFYVIGSKTN